MAEIPPAEQTEKWDQVGEQIFTGFVTAATKSDMSRWLVATLSDVMGAVLGVAASAAAPMGVGIAKGMANAEDVVAPALSDMAATAVNDMFGSNVAPAAFEGRPGKGARGDAATALGAGFVELLSGGGKPIEPGDEAAKRYLTIVMNMALEGWYQGWFFEFLSSMIPYVDVGKIEKFGSLDDKVSQALGIGRMSRRIMQPLYDATIITPLRWQTNHTYRPTLLTASEVARQVSRGRWSREQGIEELARQGYSNDRIEALFNSLAKFHSVADIDLLIRSGQITHAEGVQLLRDQGYDQAVAETELTLERLKRIQSFERSLANEAVNAYARGAVDRGVLAEFTKGVTIDSQEANQLREIAEARLALRVKQLSPSEARAAVRAGILNMRDYRRALEQDGYDDEAVAVLELLLRHELDEQSDIEELRKKQAAERAAEKAARDAATAARKAQLEQERALARRGDESDLERAAVRGLIPIARVEELYRARYDADTVQILVELLEDARADYVAQQQRAADARQRAGRRTIDLADVERAVLERVLTLDDYRRRLELLGFDQADAAVLVATLKAQLEARDEARKNRGAAGAAASKRAIDLSRFEQLVRRGRRTMVDYRALLASLNFNEAAIAGMVELLTLQIAEDAKAQKEREDAEREIRPRGLSLEEFRRAVILGLKSFQDFEAFMLAQHFTADRMQLLATELLEAVADAEAARQRREDAAASVGARALPLASVARAARLGIIAPITYQERLREAGYSEADIELETRLLLAEIADVQAARAQRDGFEVELQKKGLSLADTARAVKRGVQQLADYQARALALGLENEAAATLTRVLADELREILTARARKAEIETELVARGLSLAEYEQAVKSGARTLDDYIGELEALGFGSDDAELLAMLLDDELEELEAVPR